MSVTTSISHLQDAPVHLYVNGMNTTPAQARRQAGAISTIQGRPVYLLYNSSDGLFRDVLHSTAGTFSPLATLAVEPSARSLARTIVEMVRDNRPIVLHAYSQGGTIVRAALLAARILNPAMSKGEWMSRVVKNIKVRLYGSPVGVGDIVPDTRQYVGTIDPVPFFLSMFRVRNSIARRATTFLAGVGHSFWQYANALYSGAGMRSMYGAGSIRPSAWNPCCRRMHASQWPQAFPFGAGW